MDDTARWAARPIDYLVSSAHAHAPLLAYARTVGPWQEVLFPGFIAVVLGAAGIVARASPRQPGPGNGAALRHARHPRALVVVRPARGTLPRPLLSADVLVPPRTLTAGARRRRWCSRCSRRSRYGGSSSSRRRDCGARWGPSRSRRRSPTSRSFRSIGRRRPRSVRLRTLTHRVRAPLAEFPFYGERIAFPLHAQYMLFSTAHWLPLVNGYSDVIPADFREAAPVLDRSRRRTRSPSSRGTACGTSPCTGTCM